MRKFFYLQMDSGAEAPLLFSASLVLAIKYTSNTETKIYTNSSALGDTLKLTHASDATSTLKMQAFLVNELQKLLSTPATGVAPLLIPPVPITSYDYV